jgi:predicted nucleic acid-binding protein
LAVILADSDVLIDYLAGARPVQDQILSYVEADQLQTTAINCFELLSGAGEGKRGEAVRRLLRSLTALPLDRVAAERAAGVRRAFDREGRPIGMGDSLIAGIALTHGLALLTRNRSHFERVNDLKLIDAAQ